MRDDGYVLVASRVAPRQGADKDAFRLMPDRVLDNATIKHRNIRTARHLRWLSRWLRVGLFEQTD